MPKTLRVGPWEIARPLRTIALLVLLLWLLEALDFVLWQVDLDWYGIRPRTTVGLRNIFFAPWLHGNFNHLLANTVPLAVLGGLVALQGQQRFWTVSLIATLVSGLGVWLLGTPNSLHLGASGVIFGYLGFLLAYGFWARNLVALLTAIIVFICYGSLLWGLLPIWPGVSWTGHLFGFLGGVVAAYWLRNASPALPLS